MVLALYHQVFKLVSGYSFLTEKTETFKIKRIFSINIFVFIFSFLDFFLYLLS
jgi:uncharacterized protein with PQ loop repeat